MSLLRCVAVAAVLSASPSRALAEPPPPPPGATVQVIEVPPSLCMARGVLRCVLGLDSPRVVVVTAPPPPPVFVAPAPPPRPVAAVAVAAPPPPPEEPRYGPFLTLGARVQPHALGTGAGGFLRLEGRRLGLDLESMQVFPVNGFRDGMRAPPSMYSARLTYSVWSGERGRLRVEAGGSAAFDPTDLVVGPELGASAELRILGPLGVNGGVSLRPFPLKQLETRAAVFAQMAIFRAELGLRRVRLGDVAAPASVDWLNGFEGPYFSLALAF